jgi:hypothetical protein
LTARPPGHAAGLLDNEFDGTCARGTQGDADGDLFAALDDGVGGDSVDADGGKEECDSSEAGLLSTGRADSINA